MGAAFHILHPHIRTFADPRIRNPHIQYLL
jgi:hypothetical protein